ncbi:MAG: hypothetical protein ACK559_38580, partial [bacterium]
TKLMPMMRMPDMITIMAMAATTAIMTGRSGRCISPPRCCALAPRCPGMCSSASCMSRRS